MRGKKKRKREGAERSEAAGTVVFFRGCGAFERGGGAFLPVRIFGESKEQAATEEASEGSLANRRRNLLAGRGSC